MCNNSFQWCKQSKPKLQSLSLLPSGGGAASARRHPYPWRACTAGKASCRSRSARCRSGHCGAGGPVCCYSRHCGTRSSRGGGGCGRGNCRSCYKEGDFPLWGRPFHDKTVNIECDNWCVCDINDMNVMRWPVAEAAAAAAEAIAAAATKKVTLKFICLTTESSVMTTSTNMSTPSFGHFALW